MTILKKKLCREVSVPADHHGRNIVVELDPTGLITFRQKGLRTKTTVTLSWLYQKSVEKEALLKKKQKKKVSRGLLTI